MNCKERSSIKDKRWIKKNESKDRKSKDELKYD